MSEEIDMDRVVERVLKEWVRSGGASASMERLWGLIFYYVDDFLYDFVGGLYDLLDVFMLFWNKVELKCLVWVVVFVSTVNVLGSVSAFVAGVGWVFELKDLFFVLVEIVLVCEKWFKDGVDECFVFEFKGGEF